MLTVTRLKLSNICQYESIDIPITTGLMAVCGRNGSGKSTFAKHLNAILYPTEGKVFVNDMDTMDDSKLWDVRRSAGMVFQNPDNQIIGQVVIDFHSKDFDSGNGGTGCRTVIAAVIIVEIQQVITKRRFPSHALPDLIPLRPLQQIRHGGLGIL